MGVCYIVAAGDVNEKIPKPGEKDLLIAADAGYLHLKKQNIEPHIILGDFDSMDKPENREVIVYPVMKDDTDTILAIKLGFEKGYKKFVIYGALGGERTDHSIANLQSLGYIAQNGGTGTIVAKNERFSLIADGEIEINKGENEIFSVFAFGGNAEGVTIEGSLYDAENINLSPFFPLGAGNKIKEDKAKVSVRKGYLLVVYNK